MTEVKKQWLQMGVELEGSWTANPVDVANKVRGAKFVVDRSVHIGFGHPGEIVTRPHDQLEELITDIKALWPDHVDNSCGFHIHASFTPLQASLIATEAFFSYFKDQWAIWGKRVMKLPNNHEFWGRLAGKNKFATGKFEPEKQLSTSFAGQRPEARYTMLNFYAWEKHKTVECRLLPMFLDQDMALAAVRQMSDIYNTYLSHNKFETITVESPITVVGETIMEQYHQEMPDTSPKEYAATGTFPLVERGEGVFYAIPEAMDEVLPFKTISEKQTP